jgi:hypothetical protein
MLANCAFYARLVDTQLDLVSFCHHGANDADEHSTIVRRVFTLNLCAKGQQYRAKLCTCTQLSTVTCHQPMPLFGCVDLPNVHGTLQTASFCTSVRLRHSKCVARLFCCLDASTEVNI